MPIYSTSLLTEDLLKIWLYLWRGSDICVIVEAQQRVGNAVKSEKLRVHHEPLHRYNQIFNKSSVNRYAL